MAQPHGDPVSKSAAQFVLPVEAVDVVEVIPEKSDSELLARDEASPPGIPYKFAEPIDVSLGPGIEASPGTTEFLADGTFVWRLRVRSPGAVSINLGFTKYSMPSKGRMFIYTKDYSKTIGPFSDKDNEEHGQLWTPILPGDELVIEINLPSSKIDQLQLELTSVNRGYRDLAVPLQPYKSGSCNVDVVCPEGDSWRNQIRSVSRYIISGSFLCSGALVNNTDNDRTPYYLTAYHCGANVSTAPTMVFYWNYENSVCRVPGSPASGAPGDGDLTNFNTGAIFRSGYSDTDMILVELDDPVDPDFNVFFAGWDISGVDASSAVGIHHPAGDEKRISFENDATSVTSYGGTSVPGDGNFVRVSDWDLGTTEGGSSGSPLFDQNKRIIGQLAGGGAACGNNESDWYGRFSRSWNGGGTADTRLSDWLNPGGISVDAWDGMNYAGDNDGDGIPDDVDPDDDNDGLDDLDEQVANTDPFDSDSDDDGIRDGLDPNPAVSDSSDDNVLCEDIADGFASELSGQVIASNEIVICADPDGVDVGSSLVSNVHVLAAGELRVITPAPIKFHTGFRVDYGGKLSSYSEPLP